MTTVFVYGTLLRGMQRSTALRGARFLGLGEVNGVLLNLTHYPGLMAGNGRVSGELYEVDNDTLKTLDRIEGYEPNDPQESLFVRTPLEVTSLDDGHIRKAWTYLYNQDASSFPAIASGDYRRQIEVFLNDDTFYIAYGSNLNIERLENRVGSVAVAAKGYLEDFRLVFNKSNGDGSAFANLQSAPGLRVPFVAYHLPHGLDQLHLLDTYEGVPECYRRIVYPFPLIQDQHHALGHLYVTNPSRLSEGLLPSKDYLEHIKKGYRMHGFEDDLRHLPDESS